MPIQKNGYPSVHMKVQQKKLVALYSSAVTSHALLTSQAGRCDDSLKQDGGGSRCQTRSSRLRRLHKCRGPAK